MFDNEVVVFRYVFVVDEVELFRDTLQHRYRCIDKSDRTKVSTRFYSIWKRRRWSKESNCFVFIHEEPLKLHEWKNRIDYQDVVLSWCRWKGDFLSFGRMSRFLTLLKRNKDFRHWCCNRWVKLNVELFWKVHDQIERRFVTSFDWNELGPISVVSRATARRSIIQKKKEKY